MTDEPRNADSWAKPVSTLTVTETTEGPNLVEGKRLLSPVQGFGKMWQKTYKVRLDGADKTPQEVIADWRENFPSFWPKGNDFYPPLTGLEPGEVALIKAAGPGGMKFKTGVMVLYSDDESFTLMTPEGHMFAGWITFSSHEEDGEPRSPRCRCSCGRRIRSPRWGSRWAATGWRTSSGSRRSGTWPRISARPTAR